MPVRVGINGFGRIGRNFLRAVLESDADVEIVAANDLAPTATNAHLLKYDSTFGVLADEVKVSEDTIAVGSHSFKVFAEKDPANIPVGRPGSRRGHRVHRQVHQRREGESTLGLRGKT